jgi:uncharacterized protein (TIGR00297 family)
MALVLAVTVSFSILGYAIRGVNRSGAVAGAAVCFVLFFCAGPGAFGALALLFVVTWVATRFGRTRKQQLGTAERREGRRASQVFANLSVASICAFLYAVSTRSVFLLAFAASLAEVAADTVSGEFGQAFDESARLITTLEIVPAGTDGGITLIGTVAGIVAALVIGIACYVTGLLSLYGLLLATLAGFLGMILDSVIGAVWERKGLLNNDAVNSLSTVAAAGLALTLNALF